MLRIFVLLMLLANGAYFSWTQGWLRELGLGPAQQTEGQRLAQQIKPEAVRILSPDEARKLEAAASKATPTECLEAGPFDDPRSADLRATLESALPAGSWSLTPTVQPARWIVYMGKYPTVDAANKKKAELRARGIAFEALRNPSLEPGIGLGGFETQARAQQALKDLTQKGVRTAKLVQERPEQRGDVLRLPAVDEKVRAGLEGIREALNGQSLKACTK